MCQPSAIINSAYPAAEGGLTGLWYVSVAEFNALSWVSSMAVIVKKVIYGDSLSCVG